MQATSNAWSKACAGPLAGLITTGLCAIRELVITTTLQGVTSGMLVARVYNMNENTRESINSEKTREKGRESKDEHRRATWDKREKGEKGLD